MLNEVLSTYIILKQAQYRADLDPDAGPVQCCDTFVHALLLRAMQEYTQTSGVNHPEPAMAALVVTPTWMHLGTQAVLIGVGQSLTLLNASLCFKLQ